jgi:hypothetical protein
VRVFCEPFEKLAEIERTFARIQRLAPGSQKEKAKGLKSEIKKWIAMGAKLAALAIVAACVTGELSPEPNVGQSIHAHGGHENKRLLVRRPVVRKKSDGADPKPSPNLGLAMWPPAAAATGGPKRVKKSKTPDVPIRGSVGRLSWDNDFREIRLGGVLHNLVNRKRARFCIKYLAAWKAHDEFSARHLEKQIEPYVRAQAGMDPLPESSKYNLRIQQYFLGNKNLQKLCSELIVLAGNGRYYLRTQ